MQLVGLGPAQAVPPVDAQPVAQVTQAAWGPQFGTQSASRWHEKQLVVAEQYPALPVVVIQAPAAAVLVVHCIVVPLPGRGGSAGEESWRWNTHGPGDRSA